MSRARCTWNHEKAVNAQINTALCAGHSYQALWAHFARDDVALPGIAAFFKKAAEEEREHAQQFMELQVARGGRVALSDIRAPEIDLRGGYDALPAVEAARGLEKQVNQALLDLHAGADDDPHLADFIEGNFLTEQVDAIQELAGYVAQLDRIGPDDGAGLLQWDHGLAEKD